MFSARLPKAASVPRIINLIIKAEQGRWSAVTPGKYFVFSFPFFLGKEEGLETSWNEDKSAWLAALLCVDLCPCHWYYGM